MNNQKQNTDPYAQPPTQQQPPKKRLPKWAVALIVVLAVGIVGGLGSLSDGNEAKQTEAGTTTSSQAQAETEAPTEANDFYSVGETADINGLKITLLEVRESEGSQFTYPDEGKVFLQLIFEVSNESSKEANISSIIHFDTYVDGYAESLSMLALADAEEKSLNGTVAVGKKLKGAIGAECSSDWKEVEVIYKPSSSRQTYTFRATK